MTQFSKHVPQMLWKDGDFVLFRSILVDEGTPALVLTPASERPAPGIIARLEHAYSLRDELEPSSTARPLRLVQQSGLPALLLEDPGGNLLARLIGKPWELPQFLRVAVGIVVALGRLHSRGLIHRDINPANILVNVATGQAWLIGACFLSRLPRGQVSALPEEIAGKPAYIAPEQTGRMNRSIDARSDLYSLGVTLYEMLTGTLPFAGTDPMEWFHCHIARQPMPPNERRHDIPEPLSAIVIKLLSKTAEKRYQTAAGLEADLRGCLAAWESLGRIDPFPLGAHDMPDRLMIPEKLYGRDAECKQLARAFDRVLSSGKPELVLVSGYSGVGKSSVVNDLYWRLVPRHALFASGKFEQYRREIPYATLAQAFHTLIHQILGKNDAEVSRWQVALREAVGPNGQLVVNLVPELELVIGKQPPVPELGPQEAQNRFLAVFRRFLGAFAKVEHPLVLFLDDLQWLDAGTLELLEHIIVEPEMRHLLVVGAYRDNEVSASHPLMRTLEVIRKAGANMHEIVLSPLGLDDVGKFIADSLHCEQGSAQPLAELVHEKTGGNPFFVTQFFTVLAEEGLLVFDSGTASWTWDLTRIRAKKYTDNVVDFIAAKLNRLPNQTQQVLGRLACLGNCAEFATLALVLGEPEEQVHGALWEAVRAGLVFRLNTAYTFLHDRVQEAAYSIIPENERAAVHLRIGRLLASQTAPEEMEEKIFEVVNQLNLGSRLIDSSDEQERVAELNLMAGNRAKVATAYASALAYLGAGRILGEDSWERLYKLTFALEFQRAECEFLTGDFAGAEELLAKLSRRAGNLVDSAHVARLQTELYATLDKGDHAVEVGLQYLRRVGIDWSLHPTKDEVRRDYERIWQQLGHRSIEELVDLPPITDPVYRATLDVLTALEEPAYFADENLQCLVIARMANLSLQHGNSDGSCVAYVQLGWVVGSRFGDYQAGFRFGKLGLDLMEKRGLERFRAQVSQLFGYFVNFWSKHLRTSLGLLRRSFATAKEAGDFKYAAFFCDRLVTFLLAAGDPLGDVQREAENGLEFARKAEFGYVVDIIIGQLRFIRTLRGLTPSLSSFNDAEFDECRFEQHLEADPHLVFATCWYWIRKLQACFYAGDYTSALVAASKAEPLLQTPGHFESAEYIFYDALVRAAQYDSGSSEERAQCRETLAAHYRQILVLAENCPANFENRAALVGAEVARIEGRDLEAMRLYERAIQSAREHGFVQNEAIAHETAAWFYSERGAEIAARSYLQNARHLYLRWGAIGKVKNLDLHYSGLHRQPLAPANATLGSAVEQVDVLALTKAAQAVSSELDLNKLIETLLNIALESAGAQRGVLILLRGDEPQIEAEAIADHHAVAVNFRPTLPTPAELPDSVLRYVIRTRESIILDDASAPNRFSADEYIQKKRARSVLCLPLVKQANLKGALYLENNLASHVFTPDRISLLRFLVSQASISLDHARLVAELTQENTERKRAEEELRNKEVSLHEAQIELAHVSRVTTMGELAASIAHEVSQPLAGVVTNANASLRWLAWETPDLAEAREAIRRIIRDGIRAGDVIARMRALFKKARVAKEPLDINEAIQEVVTLIRSEVQRNKVVLRMELAADLPSVMGDQVQLQQVVVNLILNAIEAMSTVEDYRRELVIKTQRGASDEVHVLVQDSGIGFDPLSAERIFEAFHTTKPGGLGMGLSISRSIIEGHGGRLWAVLNDGPGTTFQFTI